MFLVDIFVIIVRILTHDREPNESEGAIESISSYQIGLSGLKGALLMRFMIIGYNWRLAFNEVVVFFFLDGGFISQL
jgi:putative exporter of polyketide antibiotics